MDDSRALDRPERADTRRSIRGWVGRTLRSVAIVLVAFALGIAATLVFHAASQRRPPGTLARIPGNTAIPADTVAAEQAASVAPAAGSDSGAGVATPSSCGSPPPGTALAGAPGGAAQESPRQVVEAFLAAECRGDFGGSHAYLSGRDRAEYPSVAAWATAHADLPRITGFEVASVSPDSDAVVTTLAMDSRLDPVLGLVPARATARWATVNESGAWRIAFARSSRQPLYPPDQAARDAAADWAHARQVGAPAREFVPGPLFGDPTLAERLHDSPGPVEVGDVGRLEGSSRAADLLAAFGPETLTWARTVPLRAPVPATVVLAPVADGWLVIGVLPADRS